MFRLFMNYYIKYFQCFFMWDGHVQSFSHYHKIKHVLITLSGVYLLIATGWLSSMFLSPLCSLCLRRHVSANKSNAPVP